MSGFPFPTLDPVIIVVYASEPVIIVVYVTEPVILVVYALKPSIIVVYATEPVIKVVNTLEPVIIVVYLAPSSPWPPRILMEKINMLQTRGTLPGFK